MKNRVEEDISEVSEGFILIREKTYRNPVYRIVKLDCCRYDSLTRVVLGSTRQGDWYCVKRENFYTNFESAIDVVRSFVREE